MLCVWWDIKGVVYGKVPNQYETVNAEMYSHSLGAMHKNCSKKWLAFVNRKGDLIVGDLQDMQTLILPVSIRKYGRFPLSSLLAWSCTIWLLSFLDHGNILAVKEFINREKFTTVTECSLASKSGAFVSFPPSNMTGYFFHPNSWT